MRRLLAFLALVGVAHAVGTVQQSAQNVGNNVFAFTFYWTGDAANGSVPATTAQGSAALQGFRVISIETTPGSPAPTNGYSITLIDTAGVDIMAGAAASLSASSPQSFAASPTAPPLYGTFVFTLTGNSVNSAKGSAVVYLAPLTQVIGLSPTSPSFPAQGANLIYASPNGASGSPGFRALAIPGDLGSNVIGLANGGTGVTSAQGTGNKVQLSTGAVVSGDCAKFDANGNTVDFGAPCNTLPAGTQTQYLRLQPNTGNNTTTQWNSLPSVLAADFAFGTGMTTAAYSCNVALTCVPGGTSAGSLAIGNNTLIMTPVLQGMNGSDTGHRIYVSGGTGAAEACLINGGTGLSGQASGQIIINCANTHTGAFTLQTANGGLSEAQQFLVGVGGTVVVTVPITLHAAVNGIQTTPIRWVGTGNNGFVEPISRATDYPNGDMFSLNVGGAAFGWTFDSIIIKGAIGSTVTGADVHITNNTLNMLDVILQDSQYGLLCNGCNGTVAGLDYFQTDYSFAPVAAVFISSGTSVSVDFFLTNMFLSGSSLGNANSMGAAVQLQGGDTVGISNSQLSGAKSGLLIDGSVAANFNVNDTFNGLQIVDNVNRGIQASGNANVCGNLTFSGLTITGDNTGGAGGTGQFYGIDWGASVATSCGNGIKFSGGSITTFFAHGAFVANSIDLENFIIFDNNKGNTAGQSGISVAAGVTNALFNGNHIYNTAAGHQIWGIISNGTFSGTIVGNDLSGNATGPIGVVGQLSGVIANNKGISDVIGTVADAATITPPLNPNYTITGSGTSVTAVTMTNVPAGSAGTFRTTGGALTFTATGGIGSAGTTTQNKLYQWQWDGTNLWINGPGF